MSWPNEWPLVWVSQELPEALPAARPPVADLDPSPALSIVENGPDSFAGRKIGILLSNGFDAEQLSELQSAAEAQGVVTDIVAARIGGCVASDGTAVEADQMIDGAPSVLYDAVALLISSELAHEFALVPAVRDFVTDAHSHCKFVAYSPGAAALFEATGMADHLDQGYLKLDGSDTASDFLDQCRQLRYWDRVLLSMPCVPSLRNSYSVEGKRRVMTLPLLVSRPWRVATLPPSAALASGWS